MIPVDLLIIRARDLFVARVADRRESLPVEKVAATREPRQITRLSATRCAYGDERRERNGAGRGDAATGAGTGLAQLAGRVSNKITSRTLPERN